MIEFFKNLMQPVLIASVDGDITFINKSCEELFGYAQEELLGHKVEVLIEANMRDKHVVLRNDFKSNSNFRQMGKRVIHGVRKGGEIVKFGASLSPCEIEGKMSVVLLMVDLTDIVSYKNEIQALLARKNVQDKSEFFVEHLLKGPFCDIIANLESSNLKIQDDFKDFFKSISKLNSHLSELKEAIPETYKTESVLKTKFYDRMLVVDDSDSVHTLLGSVAKMSGHVDRMLFAYNGKEAIDILNQENENNILILLDINMPVMDGFEFLEENEFAENHDVVMYSSSESKDDLHRAFQHDQVLCFFHKPLKVNEIKTKLLSSLKAEN